MYSMLLLFASSARYWVQAVIPPAPGRLSTTTSTPSSGLKYFATRRAFVSRLAPALPGTKMDTGPVGHFTSDISAFVSAFVSSFFASSIFVSSILAASVGAAVSVAALFPHAANETIIAAASIIPVNFFIVNPPCLCVSILDNPLGFCF